MTDKRLFKYMITNINKIILYYIFGKILDIFSYILDLFFTMFRFYFYCGGVYYMNAIFKLKKLGELK